MKRTLVLIPLLALALISCASPTPAAQPKLSYAVPPAPAQPPAPDDGLRQSETTDSTGVAIPNAAATERMIVYTARVSLEVQDTEKSVADITAIVTQFKGYISATNLARDSQGKYRGSITVRVPTESLDAVTKQIKAVGLKVMGENSNTNDVTDQYTDLNARLKNLTATEDELRKMMDSIREKSNKAEDILAVYRQLTEIRTQIEQIKGRMNVIEKTSTFATLTVELTPKQEIQVLDPETWVPNRTAAQALRALVQAIQGLADLAIWVGLFVLPLFIVLLIPLIVLLLILRAVLQRRGKKQVATTA